MLDGLFLSLFPLACTFGSGQPPTTLSSSSIPEPELLKVFPHNANSYVEGLVFDPTTKLLFESAGNYGASSLRELDPATGRAVTTATLPPDVFAEGVAVVDDMVIQLTYAKQVA
jgi:glutamine cyclotransferase